MKKHVGTPTWEDSISEGCDLRGSKCESLHLFSWFPAIPCAQATYLIHNLIYKNLIKEHGVTPIWEDSLSVGCDSGGSKCESPPPVCLVPCHPVHIGNIPNLIYKTLMKKHVGTTTWEDFNSSVGCDLGGSKCESPPPVCLVPCHPVHIGNIPNLIYKTLMKKHVGTTTWEDFNSSVGCDLGGSKCKSPTIYLPGSLLSRTHRQHI